MNSQLRKFLIFSLLALAPFGGWGDLPKGDTVLIPAGKLNPFWTRPKKETDKLDPIQLDSFRMMIYPVTNRDFSKFLRQRPDWQKSKARRIFSDQHYLSHFNEKNQLKDKGQANAPVTFVSWFAARDYCESLGMRLPTLSEWEYVAAANETLVDATKDADFLANILKWYSQPESKNGLAPVGKRKANFFGVHDLHGLVWEWVDDFNSNLITGESRSDGGLDRNLFCGAGGMSGTDKENYAAFMRFAFRSALKGSSTTWNLGFRCVKGVSN